MTIIKNPDTQQLNTICSVLKKGNLVVYPTDTIYGIAADITNEDAIKKLYNAKQREYNKPISICLHDTSQLKKVAITNKIILSIADKLLPGPYTLLLKKKEVVSNSLTADTDVVGVRIPNNKIAHILTKSFPITSTSANLSNHTTPTNIAEIKKQLGNTITSYIDCGIIKNNPSTIIDLTGKSPKIVRNTMSNNILKNILKIELY